MSMCSSNYNFQSDSQVIFSIGVIPDSKKNLVLLGFIIDVSLIIKKSQLFKKRKPINNKS